MVKATLVDKNGSELASNDIGRQESKVNGGERTEGENSFRLEGTGI
jgi:hypothetical protein